MPIPLGILAAAGFRPAAGGSYELIETITVGSGGAASVTFSNLNTYNTTYQHLQIRAAVRSARTEINDGIAVRLNGDSGSNYARHLLIGNGSSVSSTANTGVDRMGISPIPAANATASAFGGVVIDILDPYETKNKTIRALGGISSSFNEIQLGSGLWLNTASLTSVTLLSVTGNNLAQNSRFSIYGLRSS